MEINIHHLLQKTTKMEYYWNSQKECVDDNLQSLLEMCSNDLFPYIGTSDFVETYYKENPNSQWKIKSIFELGFPFLFFSYKQKQELENILIYSYLKHSSWFLFIFSKTDTKTINLGFNNREVYAFKKMTNEGEDLNEYPESKDFSNFCKPILKKKYFCEDYFNYIEEFCKSEKIPEIIQNDEASKDDFEFNNIPYDKFELRYLNYLYRYKKKIIEEFNYPSPKEKLLKLSNLCKIINTDNKEIKTNLNDLIIQYYYFDGITWQIYKSIYLSNNNELLNHKETIIHSFELNPFVLYALFDSSFVNDYCLRNIEVDTDYIEQIKVEDLYIFIPEKPNIKYFQTKYDFNKRNETTINSLIKQEKTSFFDNDSKKLVIKDLEELQTCFNHGAYKAAIILAGSILEAFLIDWLSEIKNVNYFIEPYFVNNHEATLSDYIKAIKILKQPSWEIASEKAFQIKEHRNQVHAKLYLSKNQVSKEICTEMIDYLKYVIQTRWKI